MGADGGAGLAAKALAAAVEEPQAHEAAQEHHRLHSGRSRRERSGERPFAARLAVGRLERVREALGAADRAGEVLGEIFHVFTFELHHRERAAQPRIALEPREDLLHETPDALSSVYCFHAPERGALSLGTVNVLTNVDLARKQGLKHVYLGYRVDGCPSLRYKGRFRPQERLVGLPGLDEIPDWRLDDPLFGAA